MAVPLPTRVGPSPRPGDILMVIHDFNARSSDELTLRKSERVELIELDDGFGDGWYLGRHLTRGSTGLFPGVYTTKAPSTVRPAQTSNRVSFVQQPSTYAAVTTSTPSEAQRSPPLPSPPKQTTNDVQNEQPIFRAHETPRSSLGSTYTTYVSRSIGEALSSSEPVAEDSAVMNETLSVIDEHITDLSTPRQSLVPPRPLKDDSGSEYSSHLDRHSYVAGPETDDEESERLTEGQVRKWDHKKMSEHLRSIGVDPKHCDIFRDQEISGDVILDMDQSFIYMKEYDFGVMGRRLKTWHKVRDFQNDVRMGARIKSSRQSIYSSVDRNSSGDDMSRTSSRMASGGSILPRIPSLLEKSGLSVRHTQQQDAIHEEGSVAPAPLQPSYTRSSFGTSVPDSPLRTSVAGDTAFRPSAAMVRELTHSRRHSSVDYGSKPDLERTASSNAPSPVLHRKQGSIDRGWPASGTSTANGTPALSQTQLDSKQDALDLATSPQTMTPTSPDMDRGYFSGNEVDNRKQRNTLRKREGVANVPQSRHSSTTAAAVKRHSRLSSIDSMKAKEPVPAAKAYHSGGHKGRFRSASVRVSNSPSLPGGTTPPTVTNLEETTSPRATSVTSPSTLASMQSRAKKMMGLRATSENLSSAEKPGFTPKGSSIEDSSQASPMLSPTGSTTPSQASHSLDIDSTDAARKAGAAAYASLPRSATRSSRPKGKQETSAYQRGLLKISPAEARQTCDYSGWMKKKSSSLMTTWKPRLFILRGRRLSYYYSETDLQERGIIDISGHKVLVANSDAMITLHAQITGATSPALDPSSPEPSPQIPSTSHYASTIPFYYKKVGTAEPSLMLANPFYFKLVPPKTGLSRAVQFTKPAVHYFQCDTIVEGRKWMGELMKATIEHDWATLETTNKQKTISLAKARARGERPKALLGDGDGDEKLDEHDEEKDANKENTEQPGGLNISGLDLQDQPNAPVVVADEKQASKTDSGVGEANNNNTNTDAGVGQAIIDQPKTA